MADLTARVSFAITAAVIEAVKEKERQRVKQDKDYWKLIRR